VTSISQVIVDHFTSKQSILLDNDRLEARSEEEALVRWKGGSAVQGVAWRCVVGKIRFPLMEEEDLRDRVLGMVGGEDGEWMAGVVADALRAKRVVGESDLQRVVGWVDPGSELGIGRAGADSAGGCKG
jgi:hypothetical protein